LHGLTRNSADFEDLALQLRTLGRVISVDQRGRGKSAYDPNYENYNPGVYAEDMFTLMNFLELPEAIIVGTSMGGIIGMIMSAMQPEKVRALVLNDIGPEIDPQGLDRIQSYVGDLQPAKSWTEAASNCKKINGQAFPDYVEADWERFAKRVYKPSKDGSLCLAYDPNISLPIQANKATAAPDLWPVFEQIKGMPLMVVRGQLSDILAASTVEKMQAIQPSLRVCEANNVGHAPTLSEPDVLPDLLEFLSSCKASG
jgi:pimeloyl-ACP methyl ester carboxylesterase